MAMTAAGMKDKIRAAQAAVGDPPNTAGGAATYSDEMLEALCQGIIDEIAANAEATITGVANGGATKVGTVA